MSLSTSRRVRSGSISPRGFCPPTLPRFQLLEPRQRRGEGRFPDATPRGESRSVCSTQGPALAPPEPRKEPIKLEQQGSEKSKTKTRDFLFLCCRNVKISAHQPICGNHSVSISSPPLSFSQRILNPALMVSEAWGVADLFHTDTPEA